MYVYRVSSDNYSKQLMTPCAYKEVRLSMSSGDFGSHTAKLIKVSSIRADEKVLHFWREHVREDMDDAEIDECFDNLNKKAVISHRAYFVKDKAKSESIARVNWNTEHNATQLGLDTLDNVYNLIDYRAKYPEIRSAFTTIQNNGFLKRKERVKEDIKKNNKFVIANPTSKRY